MCQDPSATSKSVVMLISDFPANPANDLYIRIPSEISSRVCVPPRLSADKSGPSFFNVLNEMDIEDCGSLLVASRRQRFNKFDTRPRRTVCRYFFEGLKWTSWFSVSVIGSNDSPQSGARISSWPHLHLWWDHSGMQVPVGPHSSPREHAPPSALLQVLVSPERKDNISILETLLDATRVKD